MNVYTFSHSTRVVCFMFVIDALMCNCELFLQEIMFILMILSVFVSFYTEANMTYTLFLKVVLQN